MAGTCYIAVVALCALFALTGAYEQPVPFSSFHAVRTISSRRPTRSVGPLRTANGNDASRGQFPHQVGMYVDMSVFCGGALIDPKWVLTAASCVKSEYGPRYTLYLGAENINLPAEKGRLAVTTTQAYVHDGYDKDTFKNDIALVQLPRAVPTSDSIKPISLPAKSYNSYTGSSYQLSGWGFSSDSAASITPKLQYIGLQGLDQDTCIQTYSLEIVTDNILCCKGTNKESPCQGDTGGALVQKDSDGNWVHIAVASFTPKRGCTLGKPSGFTKTAPFVEWISLISGITIPQ